MRKTIYLLALLAVSLSSQAQQYIGPGNRFLINIVNDTLAQGAFLKAGKYLNIPYHDIRLSTKGDTTFFCSNPQPRLSWSIISQTEAEQKMKNRSGTPVIVKLFEPNRVSINPDYYMTTERILFMDTTSMEIIYPDYLFPNNYIVVVKDYGYVRTFIPRERCPQKNERLLLRMSRHAQTQTQCLFDNFPVRITNDSIVPMDENKNFMCWIENGFRFPIMYRTANPKRSTFLQSIDDESRLPRLLNYLSIGYQGLMGLYWGQYLLIQEDTGFFRINVLHY